MLQKIYTVFDSVAKAYLPPFYSHNDGMAARMFADCCNDLEHAFGRNPGDYHLYAVGQWDDGDCTFKIHDVPTNLGVGSSYVEARLPQVEEQTEIPFAPTQVDEIFAAEQKANHPEN